MARKPETPGVPPQKSDREKIIDAFMSLLSERSFERLTFADVASQAEVPLHRCRSEFNGLLSVLAAKMREIDSKVLAGGDGDMAEEPARERLFDVIMRRFEALTPHKEAVRSLARSARCNPGLALALNGLATRSQAWMLEAAGIDTSGLRGAVRAQGMACLYATVMQTWIDDDDPGLARTMAALDRQLSRGARWSRFLDDVCRLAPNPCRFVRGRTQRRRPERPEEQVVPV